MTLLLSGLALAAIQVPIQGAITGADGAPLAGVRTVTLRLHDAASGGTPLHEEVQNVGFEHGTFATLLGISSTLDEADVARAGDLFVSIQVGSDAPSERAPVAWAARAVYASRAANADNAVNADNATNAANLGNQPPSYYQAAADAWTPGAGLALSGRSFSVQESTVEGFVTNGALSLAAGTTIGGKALLPAADAYTPGAGLTLNGREFSFNTALIPSESAVEGYITNGALNFASGSTIGGQSPLFAAGNVRQVRVFVSNVRTPVPLFSERVFENFTFNKQSPTSALLIQGSISGWSDASGSIQQFWQYGTGPRTAAQGVMYDNTVHGRVYPTFAYITGHTTTGAQSLRFIYQDMTNSSGQRPFLTYNPNATDDNRLSQTASVYVVWEIEP
jgi:hypothetical protein